MSGRRRGDERCSVVVRFALFIMLVAGIGCQRLNADRLVRAERVSLADERVVIPIEVIHGIPAIEIATADGGSSLILLDTGVSMTLASERWLERHANTTAWRTDLADASGAAMDDQDAWLVERYDLHGIAFHSIHALGTDFSGFEGAFGRPVDAFLGMGLFHDLRLTIDYPGEQLIVEPTSAPWPRGGTTLGAHFGGVPVPRVDISIGGLRTLATIDTGYEGALFVPRGLAGRLRWIEPPTEMGEWASFYASGQVLRGRVDGDLHIGDQIFPNPQVIIGDGPNVLIGSEVLRHFVITIDQQRGAVRLFRHDDTTTRPASP